MMPEERYADDGQEETTSDKFYYSMEELFRNKDTSRYEQARNRLVSEPTLVFRNPRASES